MTTPSNEEMADDFDAMAAEKRKQADQAQRRADGYTAEAERQKQRSKDLIKQAEGYEKNATELRGG